MYVTSDYMKKKYIFDRNEFTTDYRYLDRSACDKKNTVLWNEHLFQFKSLLEKFVNIVRGFHNISLIKKGCDVVFQ